MNLQKNKRSIKLKSPLPTGSSRDVFVQRPATCVRARVRYERKLNVSYRKLRGTFPTFCHAFPESMITIAECCLHAMPTHLHTAPNSYFMEGNRTWNLKRFPAHRDSSLNKYWVKTYQKIFKLSSSNECESLHQRVFTYAPKNTTWARNLTALCHSYLYSQHWVFVIFHC